MRCMIYLSTWMPRKNRLICIGHDGDPRPVKLSSLQVYQGLQFEAVEELEAGEIAVLSGADDVEIGDTICSEASPKALKRVSVDEPTISMRFAITSAPFAGTEGRFVQSTKIAERLFKGLFIMLLFAFLKQKKMRAL